VTDEIERLFTRARELEKEGKSFSEASSIADLERRIEIWPSPAKTFDGYLHVLIYGDFKAPEKELSVPELGLTIDPTPVEGTVIRAICVVRGKIMVQEQSLQAVCDAAHRLDLFAGVWVLAHWAHSPVRWWSYITHGTLASGGDELDREDCTPAIRLIRKLPEELQTRLRAALYWVQEPHRGLLDAPQNNALRTFTAYWSAFECLIAAVTTVLPMPKLTKPEKQKAIDDLLESWRTNDDPHPKLNLERVIALHRIVEPSLPVRSKYVFKILFRDEAQVRKYMEQCFHRHDKRNSLYQVRNDISHGNIDASDLLELIRIEARIIELWLIVWGMFGRLIPFSTPVDGDFHKPAE
jgi:hypothetical protein